MYSMYIVLILNKLHIFIYFNNLYILWDSVFIYIKYSIITNYTSEELKELGFNSTEISNMKNISMYDEILVKPDLSKVK